MIIKRNKTRVGCAALLIVALAMLGLAGSASAKLTGEFKKFEQCPYTNAEVERCVYALTESGEVVLGSKKVPIVKTVTLQAGFTEADEKTEFSKLVAAKNGITLSQTPQPVPGGLAGIVNCKEIKNIILRISCEVTFENGLTGLDSTLELARPANEVLLSEGHLGEQIGVALKMPIKIRLENPFLGESCYVGSSESPIYWELTTGTTKPPAPNKPISGDLGIFEFLEEFQILKVNGNRLVDNAWGSPGVSGCGGAFSFILDPIINAAAGLPAKEGLNTAILKGTLYETTSFALKLNDEENP